MAYELNGQMYEFCDCNVVCPCWAGEPPTNEVCQGAIAWHVESGNIEGVDVSSTTIAVVAHIPGLAVNGGWKVVILLDDKASEEQEAALTGVFKGEKGGQVADLVQVIGEVAGFRRVPMSLESTEKGLSVKLGEVAEVEADRVMGATGNPATMSDMVFSSVPGAPAYIEKSSRYKVRCPEVGIELDVSGRSAILTTFSYQG